MHISIMGGRGGGHNMLIDGVHDNNNLMATV